MSLQAWHRPWALVEGSSATRYCILDGEALPLVCLESGASWLYTDTTAGPLIDGRRDVSHRETLLDGGHGIFALPIPPRHVAAAVVTAGHGAARLDFTALPERPSEDLEPADEEQARAKALLDRVKSVWARLRDVEATLSDPGRIWVRLTELWLGGAAEADPEMDIIVHQAQQLFSTLDLLDRAPRRILRRTRRMIPLSRVQEVDRKTMTWLIRQPGETMAERGGDRQRIQAVAREENFNTLENRVLLSYARMAYEVAREYRDRHKGATRSARLRRVRGFGLRCRVLDKDLRERGVFEASADVTPNFVLQNNVKYRKIWRAWHELLRRRRILDELWRWQARSWEEFCALAVVVALQSLPGARLLAVSPLVFREEQRAGCWVKHVNPLAVFFLPDLKVTVEISYRMRAGAVLSRFGAPIWVRLGRIDSTDFLSRWAIWPVWHAVGGLEPGEAEELAKLLPAGRSESMKGGITIRPALGPDAEQSCSADAGCFTIGASGPALKAGIAQLGQFLRDHVLDRAI